MILQGTYNPDTIIHGVTLAAGILIAIVGYKIQIAMGDTLANQSRIEKAMIEAQTKMREDLTRSQMAMQRDLDQKHADNKLAIQVHQAEDAQRFDGISRTLLRIDLKLDKISANGAPGH